jgi:hypothetical protein
MLKSSLHLNLPKAEHRLHQRLVETKLTEFSERTLGEIFGLTDTGEIWQGEDFGPAVASASEHAHIVAFDGLFGFLSRSMKHAAPPRIPTDTASPLSRSVNYALTVLRWFGIWIDRRIANVRQYLDMAIAEGWEVKYDD